MKERYETPELEIVEFDDEEILTDGNFGPSVTAPENPSRNYF